MRFKPLAALARDRVPRPLNQTLYAKLIPMKPHIEIIEKTISEMDAHSNVTPFKEVIAHQLKEARMSLSELDFKQILQVAEVGLSKFCGSHEDLDLLEKILDDLFDSNVIDSFSYQRIIEKTACNRWL